MNRKPGTLPAAAIRLFALCTAVFSLTSTLVFAANPSTPGSFRHIVYSDTTAELFWDRSTDDGAIAGYELTQNGGFVTTIDALSYMPNSLEPGVRYDYTIQAIDTEGNRSEPAITSFIGGDRDSGSPIVAAPANLVGTVYSSTAAEINWDRASEFGLQYEVSRDDTVLLTTDGISYFDDALSGATTYLYKVVAIDAEGMRSAASTIELSTSGSSTPPAATPDPVTGLVASVYSSSAAELFWDQPDVHGLSYDIERNGTTVATIDGSSYFDDQLSADTSYTYQVIAFNSLGAQSAPATVVVNTSGNQGEPAINPDLVEPYDFYAADGYGTVDVIRMDVRTVTTPGICTIDDQSGCTLEDVYNDIDGSDDFKVEIPVHFQSEDFPDDGSISNAELRQRGGFSRLAPQKSYRIKLDSKEVLWRNERRIQLNKNPYDTSRIRNKLAFDVMQTIPYLPSLRTQFVNLWIDDDDGQGPVDYGLFTHAEYVGKEYLVNRERNSDDNLYKAEHFLFAPGDLDYFELDEDGAPVDEDRFEERLEIKRGEDHRMLLEMIKAVNDPAQTFDSVLDRYFDRDNILAWVTVNFLIHQVDAVTHNFYLYNPAGSEKFYFMPWDYDGAFNVEQEPANSMETDELLRRLYYGYSKGRASNFLSQYYRMPGIHSKVVEKANEYRNNQLMDSTIDQLTGQYSTLVSEYVSRNPDFENNQSYDPNDTMQFSGYVAQCHSALQNYYIPLPPRMNTPKFTDNTVTIRWEPAHDFNGNEIRYDLQVSSSPAFETGTVVYNQTGIAESNSAGYDIAFSDIGTGKRYVRLIARVTTDPGRAWQTATNRPEIDGEMRVGVMEITIPDQG